MSVDWGGITDVTKVDPAKPLLSDLGVLEAGADAIVVGDCFHDDPAVFLETIPS